MKCFTSKKVILILVLMLFNNSVNAFNLFWPSKDDIRNFHHAAIKNDIPALKAWLEKGNDVDASYDTSGNWHQAGTTGTTALILATSNGAFEAVKLLVDAGANLYAQTRSNSSHFASDRSHKVFLIENNNAGDKNIKLKYYDNGHSAFDAAISGGHFDISKYLWQKSDKNVFKYKAGTNLLKPVRRYCKNKKKSGYYKNITVFLIEHVANTQQIKYVLRRFQPECQAKLRELISKDATKALNKLPSLQSLRTLELERYYSMSKSITYSANKNKDDSYSKGDICKECAYLNIYANFYCSTIIAVTLDERDYIKENYCRRLKNIELSVGDDAYGILHSQPGQHCKIGGRTYTAYIDLVDVEEFCSD
jgi:ankyrin repeat protein